MSVIHLLLLKLVKYLDISSQPVEGNDDYVVYKKILVAYNGMLVLVNGTWE